MGKVAFQDFWIAGSRIYFQRDAIDGVEQPWLDIGTIETVNPQVTPEEVKLVDPDGGIQTIVDQALTSVEETYDVTAKNLSLENLAMMFLADAPTAFTQTAEDKEVTHSILAGRLVKIHDSDTAKTLLYGLDAISGIFTGSVTSNTLTAINASARQLTFSSSVSVTDGDPILVTGDGLSNKANSRTYTADGTQTGTTITVVERPTANETAVTVTAYTENAGTIFKQGTDWDVVSADRGIARIIDGGAITSGDYTIAFSVAALSGNRTFNPQTAKGTITGRAILIYSRRNNADQTVREMEVAVTPNSSSIQDTDFSSMVLTFTVLNDLTSTTPAGRVLQFKGSLPDKS